MCLDVWLFEGLVGSGKGSMCWLMVLEAFCWGFYLKTQEVACLQASELARIMAICRVTCP